MNWWKAPENEWKMRNGPVRRMLHGLLWFPLLLVFVLLAALGWLERRRQSLFRTWAEGAELMKLDGCGGAQLKDGRLQWCSFEAGRFQDQGDFDICRLELVELMAIKDRKVKLVLVVTLVFHLVL